MDALDAHKDENYSTIGREIKNRNRELNRGDLKGAQKTQKTIQNLLRKTRNK